MALKISRILHAGYVFESNKTCIAFDPVFENPFSRNCHAFPQVKFDLPKIQALTLSAVFISHFHDDHCSLESLNLLDKRTPIFCYCLHDELFDWLKTLGFQHIEPLRLNSPVQIGDFKVIPRRALESDVDSMLQIRIEGLNILNVVDSWIDEDTLEFLKDNRPWDMILWPFQTMRELEVLVPSLYPATQPKIPDESLQQLEALNPRYVIPSSHQFLQEPWSWYNHALFPITYKMFEEDVARILPRTTVVRLNPSCTLHLGKTMLSRDLPPLDWIQPIGPQGLDYDYRPQQRIPPVSEIAQNFAELNRTQRERVTTFCQTELAQKFNQLEATKTQTTRSQANGGDCQWWLCLYDHLGKEVTFQFQMKANVMSVVAQSDLPVMWITQVPAFKLYAALEEGESLTSMYLRIHQVLDASSFDVLDDPLIRCLFDGEFGSYQRAQLQRIRANELKENPHNE